LISAIAVDGSGTLYAAGPVYTDAFAAKLSADGKTLLWSTFYSGASGSGPAGVATTASGDAWIAGTTMSSDLPITPNAYSGSAPFGGPEMAGQSTRSFPIPASGCNIPSTAAAYSMNVTVVPDGMLSYLSAWPTGSPQPLVSTLNSFDGAVVANAAIVPAGTNGAIDIYVTNPTHVILDINGYFAP
jgi:hypothetical protein